MISRKESQALAAPLGLDPDADEAAEPESGVTSMAGFESRVTGSAGFEIFGRPQRPGDRTSMPAAFR